MGTGKIIIAIVVVVAAVAFYVLVGPSRGKTVAKKAWANRLKRAATATHGERAVEGTIEATGDLLDVPGGGTGAAAYAAWTNTKKMTTADARTPSTVQFAMAPFDLRSADGVLRIDGTLVGLADLQPRTRLDGEIRIVAHPGNAITVFGVVTERDGVPGIYGDVMIVQAPLKEWLRLAGRPLVSMPFP